MAWFPISKQMVQYYNPSTNVPYSGAVLKAYTAGTTTNINFATDSTGGTLISSVAINASGYPESSGTQIIPHISEDFKLALYPTQAAADADTGADWTIDNIAASLATNITPTGSDQSKTISAWIGDLIEDTTPFGQCNIKAIVSSLDAHYGFNSGILETNTEGKWVVVYRKGAEHGLVNGSSIYAMDTYDNGMTFVNKRLIYRDANNDTRNFVSAKMNDRIGIVATRRNESAVYDDSIFIYSDDDGVTWSSSTITAPSSGYAINFHGNIVEYPASVGGDDDNGFVCYSYGTGGDMDALYTTDKGTTWAWSTAVAVNTVDFSVSEMSVTRLGTEDKWVMVCRTGNTTNAAASISTNPVTGWSSLVDTGLYNIGNPPTLIYDDNQLWFFTFSRKSREISSDLSSHLLFAKIDADTCYAAGGAFTGKSFNVLTPVPNWGAGYLFPYKINGKWFGTFLCAELEEGGTSNPKSSILCMIGDFISLTTTPHDILDALPRRNEVKNGGFDAWTYGASFTLTSTAITQVANSWEATAASGDTTVIQQKDFTAGQNEVEGNPSHYLSFKSTTVSGPNSHYFSQKFGRVSLHNRSWCTLSFWARMPTGTKTNIGRIRIVQNFGTGGSPSSNVTNSIGSDFAIGTTWQKYVVNFEMFSIAGKTLGSNNDDYVQLLFYPIFAENASYELDITHIKLERGPVASEFIQETLDEIVGATGDISTAQIADGAITNSKLAQGFLLGTESLTIATGAITVTSSNPVVFLTIGTEGGAGTDDLDTITPAYDGQIFICRSATSSEDPTFKDGTGNLSLAGDFTLTNAADRIVLLATSGTLFELSRSDNA